MLYLKNALGGLGRSVTDTARYAFASVETAGRWRKLAMYLVMFALPGGSVAVLLLVWANRRRAQRTAGAEHARSATTPVPVPAQPCAGGQPACRAASAAPREHKHSPALTALRRWRRNDA